MSCSGVAKGFMYILYTSNVRIEDTAMSSDEEDEVTAMKSVSRSAMDPDLPRRATAANGPDSPDDTCEVVILCGYVGHTGLSVNATAASPRVVAKPNGIANYAMPPNT